MTTAPDRAADRTTVIPFGLQYPAQTEPTNMVSQTVVTTAHRGVAPLSVKPWILAGTEVGTGDIRRTNLLPNSRPNESPSRAVFRNAEIRPT